MASKNFNIKLEEDKKERAESIYKDLGVDKPNKATLLALLKVKKSVMIRILKHMMLKKL